MNRRQLLAGLLGATGGLVLPYEPKRIYSTPSPGVGGPLYGGLRLFGSIVFYLNGRRLLEVPADGEPCVVKHAETLGTYTVQYGDFAGGPVALCHGDTLTVDTTIVRRPESPVLWHT